MSVKNRQQTNLLLLLFPATAWLLVFFILPVLIVLLYSFLERGTYGGVTWIFTLSNYQRLFSGLFLEVIGRSLGLAFLTTAACLLVGYPLAFFIATRSPRWRNALLLLVIIPFWTNFLVRTYAWIIL
ncbi:MAG: ABC transporter permease, partial [Microcoleus sp. T1-bin1]|nr:ABC transporter permease [Microcoleus sp. T1-bin1]